MICPNCSKNISDGSDTCEFCGHQLFGFSMAGDLDDLSSDNNTRVEAPVVSEPKVEAPVVNEPNVKAPENNSNPGYSAPPDNSYSGYAAPTNAPDPAYGAPVNNPPYANSYAPPVYYADNYKSRGQQRQEEINEINRMISYFSKVQDAYDEYDRVCMQLNPANLRKRPGLLVWGIILLIPSVLLFIISLFTIRSLTIISLISCVGSILMIVGFGVTTGVRNRNFVVASRRYEELSEYLYKHYINYGECLIGPEYTNPSNLRVILQTIQSGRADNTKDAINVLVEDTYRNNMQAFAQQTAISSAAAARGARATAIFSAANFFFR